MGQLVPGTEISKNPQTCESNVLIILELRIKVAVFIVCCEVVGTGLGAFVRGAFLVRVREAKLT